MTESYEENLSRLEGIVTRLEKGDLPLEESLLVFEEGMKLAQECSRTLSQVEQKIKKLVESPLGGPELEEIEPEEVGRREYDPSQ
ncbi:MAG: exodeoxyribonuclease VII small subunit [Armatimonadetes bacterium]|nr:exodeoxyribonuclease VII small subunit [Armatimonadota bacterium]